jgi:hypothetical protein
MQTVPSLSDLAVRNAKALETRYKIADDFGLYPLVMPKAPNTVASTIALMA